MCVQIATCAFRLHERMEVTQNIALTILDACPRKEPLCPPGAPIVQIFLKGAKSQNRPGLLFEIDSRSS
jgi:hypothetical protein